MKAISLLRTLSYCCVVTFMLGGCKQQTESEYLNLPHKGEKKIRLTEIKNVDTVIIDGGSISLEGKWVLNNGKLFFIDKNLVGIREFDLNGNYIQRHIQKGRGPNEWYAPFITAVFSDDNEIVGVDQSWMFLKYDSLYKRMLPPFHLLSDIRMNDKDWQSLLNKPDTEHHHMYTFNVDSKDLALLNNKITVPVAAEHVDYNGYYTRSNAKDFWKNSHTFLFIDLVTKKTKNLFGTYPPVYSTKNIPAFSAYSFDTFDDQLYTTFAADPLIYVRDKNGKLVYSFGFEAEGMDNDYPETTTYEQFGEVYKEHLDKYSYYTKLKITDSYIFRTYKLKKGEGYGIQIYHNNDLVGEIRSNDKLTILGSYNNICYGISDVDFDTETFNLIKFTL